MDHEQLLQLIFILHGSQIATYICHLQAKTLSAVARIKLESSKIHIVSDKCSLHG